MNHERDLVFWLRWVAANALGEAIGLGAAVMAGAAVGAVHGLILVKALLH